MHSIFTLGVRGSLLSPIRHHRLCSNNFVISACLLLCFANVAAAQSSSTALTLQAALELAESRSATLQAQDSVKRAAREMAVSASRLPDPLLRLSVDNLPVEGAMRYSLTDDFMTMRSVSLMQTFTAADKRQARSVRYEREAEAASSEQSLLKAWLLTQTAKAWFDRYYQEQMLELLQRQRDEAKGVSEAIESSYSAGRLSQADVLAAQSAVAQIDNRMLEARAELSTIEALLQRWIGDAASDPLALPPRIDSTRLVAHQLADDIDLHPDVAVLNARERIALADVDLAELEKDADWSWSLMYSKRGSQFGDMVSLGVSIPLQWDQANKQDREVAARLAQVEQVRFEREELRREHLFETQRLLVNWRSNLTRLDNYNTRLIPLATQRVEALIAAFRGGKASLAEVLEAQRMLIDTQLDKLGLEKQTAAWWAELEFLIPRDYSRPTNSYHPSKHLAEETLP
ncbi:TolC family protein [uncultured Rheinheimera sp.]|uniref:TolC family protein n=1 Tax=uncultured Rheinheimera sp. TaxID=400532 RepID=UPI002591D27A|nr:TolC family protein [uncultured Rheinheimera sp.]